MIKINKWSLVLVALVLVIGGCSTGNIREMTATPYSDVKYNIKTILKGQQYSQNFTSKPGKVLFEAIQVPYSATYVLSSSASSEVLNNNITPNWPRATPVILYPLTVLSVVNQVKIDDENYDVVCVNMCKQGETSPYNKRLFLLINNEGKALPYLYKRSNLGYNVYVDANAIVNTLQFDKKEIEVQNNANLTSTYTFEKTVKNNPVISIENSYSKGTKWSSGNYTLDADYGLQCGNNCFLKYEGYDKKTGFTFVVNNEK